MAAGIGLILMLIWGVGLYNLGYLVVGRLFGFELSEFSIGFPPGNIASFSIGTTQYRLTPFLLGGLVRFRHEPNNLRYVLTILSGPLTVIIFSILLTWSLFVTFGYDAVVPNGVIVDKVSGSELATGFLPGDQIIAINGVTIRVTTDAARELSNWEAGTLQIKFLRNDQVQEIMWDDRVSLSNTAIMFMPVYKRFQTSLLDSAKYIPKYFKELFCSPTFFVNAVVLQDEFKAKEINFSILNFRKQDKFYSYLLVVGILWFYLGILNLYPFPNLVGDLFLERVYKLITGLPPTSLISGLLKVVVFGIIIGLNLGISISLIYSTNSPATFMYRF